MAGYEPAPYAPGMPIGTIRRRRGDRFYLDARPHGTVYSLGGVPFVGDEGRVVAEAVLAAIELAVSKGAAIDVALAPYLGSADRARVVASFDRWLDHQRSLVEAGERSHNTVREYARFRSEIEWWGDRSIHDVSYASIEDWHREVFIARGLSWKSRKNYLGIFRSFLGWLVRRGELAAVPLFPEIAAEEHVPSVLCPEDQAAVLEAIDDEHRGAFLVAGRMGLRPGEVRALDVSDIDRSGEVWWLNVSKAMQGPNIDAEVGPTKTRQTRRLPIPPEVKDWLAAHVDWTGRLTAQPLFTFRGHRLSEGWLRKNWKSAAKKVGLSSKLYEGTKHSAATQWLASGLAMERIQKYLGHRDIQSTAKYARVLDQDLLDFIRNR